jgi:hypothetical protein
MKSSIIRKLIMGMVVGIMLLIGIGSTTANAQGRGFRRHHWVFFRPYRPFWGPYTYVRVVDPIAAQKEQGYNDGRSKGKDDAKEGKEEDPESHKKFDKSKSLAYREAFLQGYADGYRKQMKKSD